MLTFKPTHSLTHLVMGALCCYALTACQSPQAAQPPQAVQPPQKEMGLSEAEKQDAVSTDEQARHRLALYNYALAYRAAKKDSIQRYIRDKNQIYLNHLMTQGTPLGRSSSGESTGSSSDLHSFEESSRLQLASQTQLIKDIHKIALTPKLKTDHELLLKHEYLLQEALEQIVQLAEIMGSPQQLMQNFMRILEIQNRTLEITSEIRALKPEQQRILSKLAVSAYIFELEENQDSKVLLQSAYLEAMPSMPTPAVLTRFENWMKPSSSVESPEEPAINSSEVTTWKTAYSQAKSRIERLNPPEVQRPKHVLAYMEAKLGLGLSSALLAYAQDPGDASNFYDYVAQDLDLLTLFYEFRAIQETPN